MRKGFKRLHPTLAEMWLIIGVWGVLLQAVILIFTNRRLYYSIGCWAGIFLAVLCSGLMLRAITNGLDMEEEDAAKYYHRQYAIRALTVVVVFFALALSRAGSVLTAFGGVFSLKASAYLQPAVHRLPVMSRLFTGEENSQRRDQNSGK